MFSFSNLQGLVNDNSFLTQYLPFLEMNFGEGDGTPLQYSCLENPMDGGAWWAALHGVVKSWTRLSDFTFTFHFHALEKEMATHSSVLAWRIPGTEEPGGLPSIGSHRVGHYWSDLAAEMNLSFLFLPDFPNGLLIVRQMLLVILHSSQTLLWEAALPHRPGPQRPRPYYVTQWPWP